MCILDRDNPRVSRMYACPRPRLSIRTPLRASYTGMKYLWLPRTVLEADFLDSMPKIKTHHWSGVTLSMEKMFGVVPGTRYRWPKNILHWKVIQESILDLCATIPIHFVIADGIVAMKETGPLTAPLVFWERLCLRTFRWLPMQPAPA